MRLPPDDTTLRLVALSRAHLREPSDFYLDSETGPVVVFDPTLTPVEQRTFDGLVAVLTFPLSLTPAEWTTIRPRVQALRDFRQLGRNAFMALTAAERDRMLYDAQTATTIVLLALLRD